MSRNRHLTSGNQRVGNSSRGRTTVASVLGLALLAACTASPPTATEQAPVAASTGTVQTQPAASPPAILSEAQASKDAEISPVNPSNKPTPGVNDPATQVIAPGYDGTVFVDSEGRMWAGASTVCVPLGQPGPTSKLGYIQQQQVSDEIVAEPCTMGWGHWGLTLYRFGFSGGPIDVEIPDIDSLNIDCTTFPDAEANNAGVCVAWGNRFREGTAGALLYLIPETGPPQPLSTEVLAANAFSMFETDETDGGVLLIGFVKTGDQSETSAPRAFKTWTVTESGATLTGCSEFSADVGRPHPTTPQTGTCDF